MNASLKNIHEFQYFWCAEHMRNTYASKMFLFRMLVICLKHYSAINRQDFLFIKNDVM